MGYGSAIPGAIRVGKALLKIDYQLMRRAHWKPGAARGISHGLAGDLVMKVSYH